MARRLHPVDARPLPAPFRCVWLEAFRQALRARTRALRTSEMLFEHLASDDPEVVEWLRVETSRRWPWRAALNLIAGGRLDLFVWRRGRQPWFSLRSVVVPLDGSLVLAAFEDTASCLVSLDSEERRSWELQRLEELWGRSGPTEG